MDVKFVASFYWWQFAYFILKWEHEPKYMGGRGGGEQLQTFGCIYSRAVVYWDLLHLYIANQVTE